ncbi:MAG TPA: ParB N-terminal domain-containing protein [Syntrophales bacterium]|nr:ParB N-terminal domain-containing protein [Syntrophales bacterium]
MVVMYVGINDLKANPENLFEPLPPDEYQELKDSIGKHGIREPLIICRNGDGHSYTILCGHNRHRVAKELSLSSVPCILVPHEEAAAVIDTEIYRRMLSKEERREAIAKKEALQRAKIGKYLDTHLHEALKKLLSEGKINEESALHYANLPMHVQSEAYQAMCSSVQRAVEEVVVVEPDPAQQAKHAQEISAMQEEVNRYKDELNTIRQQMKDKEKRLRDLNNQRDKAREMIEEQQEVIKRLKSESFEKAKESLRAEVENRINEARQRIDAANKAIGEKDMEIDRLNEEIARQKRRVWDTEALVKSAEVEAKMFKDDLVAKIKNLYSPQMIRSSIDSIEYQLKCVEAYLGSTDYLWDAGTVDDVSNRLHKIRQRIKDILRNTLPDATRKEALRLPNITPMLPEDRVSDTEQV